MKERQMQSQIHSHEISQLEANLFSAFADPTRLLILYALHEQPRNVTELAENIGVTQPTTSRHLKILRDHELVHTTRQGVFITYALTDPRLIEALDILRSVLLDNLASKANLASDGMFH